MTVIKSLQIITNIILTNKTKPDLPTYVKSWRKQTKATFELTSTKTKAQISIDLPHTNNPAAPQIPHVGYKTGGKKKR
ncbi:MAG: hypothetical protein K1W39_13525 [Lachnospiraceae bacterium]